ncbi:MAG TPA: hypothetical protein VGM16_04315 [Gammaproteobacteria bacterium]|jgi:hypothetical protein
MNKGILIIGLCLSGVLAAPVARADLDPAPLDPGAHLTGDFGITDGGDALVTFTYTNGSTKTLHAGESAYLDAGMLYKFDPSWSLKTTLGWARASVDASNASVSFVRYPLDMLGVYSYGNNHFGLGLTYHMSPKVSGAGLPSGDFDNALGLVAEYRYWIFGLRLTSINYKVSSTGQSISGNSYGAFLNFTF